MNDDSLSLTFARRQFDRAVYEFEQRRLYGVPADVRSIWLGEIQSWGFFLAGQVDSDLPDKGGDSGERKRLWERLATAKARWAQILVDAMEESPIMRQQLLHPAEHEIVAAWKELATGI